MFYLIDDINSTVDRILSDSELSKVLSKDQVVKCLESFNGDEIATAVFFKKYALRDKNNNILEFSIDDAKNRWAKEISRIDNKDYKYFRELYDYMLPAGRQMFALGNNFINKATLTNCYVTEIKDDSIEGIFDAAKVCAKTYSYGGGIGLCIGKLRPVDSKVSNSAKFSTGAVSFMELYSMTTNLIGQHGRRGALLISIPINHPDIEHFIDIKNNNINKVKYANISIKITDDFMNAVINDGDFELYFKTEYEEIKKVVKARHLWDKIVSSAHKSAEPGLLFWDHAKNMSPSDSYPESKIHTTNPCGEQYLENSGACNLASLLLDSFVKNPYTENAYFDFELFSDMISRSVRHLDNVIELNKGKHALVEQEDAAVRTRRVGLGITGLADMLISLGIKYDSQEALDFMEKVMNIKMESEYNASIELAKERGSFPLFNPDIHFERGFCKNLPNDIKEKAKKYGLRNIATSTVAPSGSLSIIAQCSSGIEPIFALSYSRFVQMGGQNKKFTVHHQGLKRFYNIKNKEPDYDVWIVSHQIDYKFRIKMQGLIQKYVDSSISSTINLPESIDKDTVSQIYIDAWKYKLKGITVYREGSREGILVTDDFAEKAGIPQLDTSVTKFHAEGGDKFYVLISYKNKDIKLPYQVFVLNYKLADRDAFVKISNSLIKMLKNEGVSDDRIQKYISRSKDSLQKLTRFLSLSMKTNNLEKAIEILNDHAFAGTLASKLCEIFGKSIKIKKSICKNCGSSNVRMEEGCMHCLDCNWSGCN